MEHAPLRAVPTRPSGPGDPADAAGHVASTLPGLDAAAATALSLVALVGRSRAAAAEAAGLDPDRLGAALARARKALRRSMFPLPGSGWCERAERLISDRLDDALEDPGPKLLDVHLRNCSRCVEHERRLVQATDAMVAAFAATPEPAAAPTVAPESPPALSVVERAAAPPPAVLPFGEPVRPAPARVRRPRPVAAPAPEPPAPKPAAPAEPPPAEPAIAPEPAGGPEPTASPAHAPPARGPRRASRFAWAVLLVLAVLFAVVTLAITVGGVLGLSL